MFFLPSALGTLKDLNLEASFLTGVPRWLSVLGPAKVVRVKRVQRKKKGWSKLEAKKAKDLDKRYFLLATAHEEERTKRKNP